MIPLTPEKIEQHLLNTGKKGGELTKAYRIARDPSDWKAGIVSRQLEYEQLQAAVFEDQDELQSEEEAGGKKRKRKSDAGPKKVGADKKAKVSQSSKAKVRFLEPSRDLSDVDVCASHLSRLAPRRRLSNLVLPRNPKLDQRVCDHDICGYLLQLTSGGIW